MTCNDHALNLGVCYYSTDSIFKTSQQPADKCLPHPAARSQLFTYSNAVVTGFELQSCRYMFRVMCFYTFRIHRLPNQSMAPDP